MVVSSPITADHSEIASPNRKPFCGALWEQSPNSKLKPICPKCEHSMQIMREDAQRKGMVITLQDRQPRNVYLQCSNRRCGIRLSTNMPRNQLESKVRKLFEQQ